jgi:4-nitrophenyl phosphatase
MDGVLYRGDAPLPSAAAFIARLQALETPFLLVTNNSTRTPGQYVRKLSRMGIRVTEDRLLTSAQGTARHLASLTRPGTRIYAIGETGLREALAAEGFTLADDPDVDFVVVGLDRQLTYDKLRTAVLAIRRGALFVATNPDRTLPTEEGLYPGAGAILAAIQAATDVAPTVIGKPQPTLFKLALARLDVDRSGVAVIGDQVETDIRGGQAAGLATILVLTGAMTREDLERSSVKPDWVFDDLAQVEQAWLAARGDEVTG